MLMYLWTQDICIVNTNLQGGVSRGKKERERETFRHAVRLRTTRKTKTGVVRRVCCSSGDFCFLVGVVWLTCWGLLPGWGQPEACLGCRPFIGFLIGGSAVKRLTLLAWFLAAFPPMKCTQESGDCGPKVTETQESFQWENTYRQKHMLAATKGLLGLFKCLNLYQRKTEVSFRQCHS